MRFRLLTDFTLHAPRAAVYEAVRAVEQWPTWWRGCEDVTELARGGADGVGARHLIAWRSRLPYRVTFEVEVAALERDELIRGHARGDLDGVGIWRFADAGGGTRVEYLWDVEARKRWMRLLAPLLAPVFTRNHDWLMEQGALGLARLLRAPPPTVGHARM